jgi:hypothetical protein
VARRSKEAQGSTAIKKAPSRTVPDAVRMRLIACSAGRCEFRGCNADLFQHPITGTPGNYSQTAHIFAFGDAGPRPAEGKSVAVHAFENLMLLCGKCHHLVDKVEPKNFSASILREHKREHEERIFTLTATGPEHRTTVIELRATIGGQLVDLPVPDIHTALYPRYPARLPGVLIDISGLQREDANFFNAARDQIRRELRPALRAEFESKHVQHYSVFALAPIPVLVCLGRAIGNKVTADLYQRQKSDGSWRWREDGEIAVCSFSKLRDGTDPHCVALQLSLSGKIDPSSLPDNIDGRFAFYEITLTTRRPSVDYMRRREDLDEFRATFREALGAIHAAHSGISQVHLISAVPAPVAIACGQEVMPKAHAALVVYDNVKGKFQPAITINTEEDL